MERAVRGGLRTDAILLFALARSFVGSVSQTPDHSALKSRSRIGLHRDGDGAHVELAFPRPNYFRNHDFKHSDRDGLHRRRYAERKTSWSIRPDRRGIGIGFTFGPAIGGLAGDVNPRLAFWIAAGL